jgi:ATP-dependent RNA helicase DDX51/DBP6
MSKKSRKHDELKSESVQGIEADENAQDPPSSKKSKKNRVREETSVLEGSRDVLMTDANGLEPQMQSEELSKHASPDEGKTEKDKKKKRKKPLESEIVPESDDERAQRHRSVLERKEKSLKLASNIVHDGVSEAEPEDVHDLAPLPQPILVAEETPKLTYDTLPPWLSAPIRVSQDSRKPFTELGLLPKAARVLEERGFPDAFAVQTAAIPLLLPTSKQQPGDVLVAAPTGSGKTLAYALPIVRDISQGLVTRLRALVVLPTRELVRQAQEVFELCARAYEGGDRKRVRIGVAIGSQTIKSEQMTLVGSESRYDPETYARIQSECAQLPSVDFLAQADPRMGRWKGEVVDFISKVDVLICTPGRLVEHIEQTPGFDLDYVRWLVVDEADKLLAQSFQGWLDIVMEKFKTSKFTAREFSDVDLDGVRKVVLSATLTRDLSLLNQLALRRPQLIVLENEGEVQVAEHSLPSQLEEFAIRVHNINLKPLYLLDLLRSKDMGIQQPGKEQDDSTTDATSDASSESESESDSDSDSSSDTSSSGSAEDSPKNRTTANKSKIPISLIFTKSNEAALRLSRLLCLIDGSLEPHVSTLTSTTPTHIRRKILRAFTTQSSPTRLVIASDLVARGIDLPRLDNVINYDLPPSVAGYVHRVGRTARAGRSGRAWTLVGDDESGWFWGKIAKGSGVRRAQKVGRIRIEEIAEERVGSYEAALEKLGQEALHTKRG